MDRHVANAQQIVELLVGHPKVRHVLYPGLEGHPGHAIAERQMKSPGGMVSLRLAAGLDAAKALTTHTRLFTLAESLGGIESLIEHPGVMTHASVAGSPLEVPDDLVRLSVGIETGDDLVADLEHALDQI
jgi:cystathionine gamma-synthase